VLAAYKTEHAAVAEQIRLLNERHQALEQFIVGLEALIGTRLPDDDPSDPTGLAAAVAGVPARPEVSPLQSVMDNALAVFRYLGRPLDSVEVTTCLAEHGIKAKRGTVYRTLHRAAESGVLVVHGRGRFGLP
jgi:hypothetical protein